MDETPEQWEAFLELMLSTWSVDEMSYMAIVQQDVINKEKFPRSLD